MNRRAFFGAFERQWASMKRHGGALGCIMLDVDHFKSVNDQHGHQTGDQVLERVAHILKSEVRITDIVCRYGGEEFCVLLPDTDAHGSAEAAERLRQAIQERRPGGLGVTCSFGVSGCEFGADSPQALIDEADKALYAAKRGGRNRVRTWESAGEVGSVIECAESRGTYPTDSTEASIPYGAVSALTTALRHRDPDTCAHSHRVADLCVMTVQDLLSPRDCFIMEIAGLLHDIGKIGVPDEILLKPGPLTDAEWEVMSVHDRLGVEIVDTAFNAPELTNIIRCHHAHYNGSSRDPGLPRGMDIPMRARVLAIADAFDAMVSKRVYRDPMTCDQAIDELRRCSGSQFDPDLAKHFIARYQARLGHEANVKASDSLNVGIWLGLEAEHLSATLAANDFTCLGAVSERLADVATKLGLPQIASLAIELRDAASDTLEIATMIRKTRALVELCGDTQKQTLSLETPGLRDSATPG
jgi:diguanylate cyclase (GGDEF)-like protein